MSSRTTFLSKLIGLFAIAVSVSMITHREQTLQMIRTLLQDPSMLFCYGMLAVATGLAIILAHNLWSGETLTVIVTLIGWLTLAKGLALLLLSPGTASGFFLGGLHYAQYFYFYFGIPLILGAYLTIGGFKSAMR